MSARKTKSSANSNELLSGEFTAKQLAELWARLHEGDREPAPAAAQLAAARRNSAWRAWFERQAGPEAAAQHLLAAWQLFHRGDFRSAIAAGESLDGPGITVANKAAGVLATYLENNDSRALQTLQKAVARGERAVQDFPDYANAHYMLAFVLGRYSQRISIVQALAEGHATRVRRALERCLELEPRHADAHIALGVFHAEIVGKLGSLAAGLTYGASRKDSITHFDKALELAPHSVIARVEYAHALGLLDAGRAAERARLLKAALKLAPLDAMERLDHERAQRDLVAVT